MFKIRGLEKNEQGWFLVSVLVMTMLLTLLGVSIAALVAEEYQHTTLEQYTQNASLAAEAGIEQSIVQLNANDSFAGYSTPQVYFIYNNNHGQRRRQG
jgi:Tfp pilus assembly protein PilX